MPITINDEVATAFKQTLIFSILTLEKEKYLSPKVLGVLFVHTQRTGFSAILHAIWEGGIQNKYIKEDCSRGVDPAKEDSKEEEEDNNDKHDNDVVVRVAESKMGDAEEDVELRSFHNDYCSPSSSQGCSPVDDFHEQMGEEPNSEVIASLNDITMEIAPEQPEDDRVIRLDA